MVPQDVMNSLEHLNGGLVRVEQDAIDAAEHERAAAMIASLSIVENHVATQDEELEKAKELAYTDTLTGAHTTRALIDEFERKSALGDPFVAVMLDLENFGAINKKYGHQTGDAILVLVTHLLNTKVGRRENDFLATFEPQDINPILHETQHNGAFVSRKGGDEFALFMDLEGGGKRTSELTQEEMEEKAAIFKERVENLFEGIKSDPAYQEIAYILSGTGFHVGCAIYDPKNPESLAKLLQRADPKGEKVPEGHNPHADKVNKVTAQLQMAA